jgi:hypothetical protein
MGHSPAIVWKYTPRQMHALLFIAGKRRDREKREMLELHATAAQGDSKTINKLLKGDRADGD